MSFDELNTLPTGWRQLTVAQLVADGVIEKPLDGNHGGIHPKADDYVESGVPFVMASDLDGGRVDLTGCKFITEEQARGLRKGFAKAGDVLLSHKATIGRTAIVQDSDHPFIVLTPQVTYYRVSDISQLNAVYLKAYFDSTLFQTVLGQWAGSGSTRAYLGITGQLKLPIIVPPIDFQNSIAEQAGDLNDKIQINQQINQTLEQMAQAIFKSWFVDFEPVKAKIAALEASGSAADAELAAMQAISGKDSDQLQQMASEQPEKYAELRATAELFPSGMQECELGEIPEGWEVRRIDDVIQRLSVGKKYSQKTVSDSGSVPVLDQGKSGIIGYHNDKPGVKASTDDPVIVFANHTCYMRIITHDFSTIQNVLPFKGLDVNVHWLYFATLGKQKFVEYKGHWPDFVIKEIVIPNGSLTDRFGQHVFNMMTLTYRNEQQNQSLCSLRDSLLPKLLSGELTLPETDSIQDHPHV